MLIRRTNIAHNKKMVEQHREEKQGLDGKIEKGFQYLQFEKEIEENRKKDKRGK